MGAICLIDTGYKLRKPRINLTPFVAEENYD